MWGWIQLGIWAGLYVANYLMRPKPVAPKPLTRDNLTLPRTEEGSAVPLVFGRCRVDSPLLVWTSDLYSKLNSMGNGVSNYTYALNMLFVVGAPMKNDSMSVFVPTEPTNCRLYNVWCGDKKIFIRHPFPGGAPGYTRAQGVTKPDFFGGPGAGGGLYGAYQFFWGSANQSLFVPPSAIGNAIGVAKLGDFSLVPGYRNQMLVGFTGLFHEDVPGLGTQCSVPDGPSNPGTHPNAWTIGENANVEGFSFEVSSYGNYPATITARGAGFSGTYGYDYRGDADPIAVVYDILTNSWSRIGLDTAKIDEPSFLSASTALKAEGHGYSRVHYETQDGVTMISDVLAQIDCALYEEPTTGKLVTKLIRPDYNPLTLALFNESNIIDIDDYSLGGWKESINEVRVQFTDRSSEYKPAVAVAQSLANATINGNRRRSKTLEYAGISNSQVAAQVAAREMNVLSRPLKRISMTVNRDGYNLRPGTCFKVTFAEYNLNATIFRCQRVDLGQLFDNKVTLEAVEDAFASTYQGYGYGWGIISWPTPSPLVDETAVEVPRWLARKAMNAGLVGNELVPRFMPLAHPSTNALRYSMTSRAQPTGISGTSTASRLGEVTLDPVYGLYTSDMPASDFPMTFTVAAAYRRELEPYDDFEGFLVENVSRPDLTSAEIQETLTLSSVSTNGIRNDGNNLILIVTPSGAHEIMAYETATPVGAQFLFTNVWRGLLDTPPIDIPIGSRGYFLNAEMTGRRGYTVRQSVNYQIVPSGTFVNGSGADEYAATQVRGRAVLSYPPQDMRVAGERAVGTEGNPAVANQYKDVSFVEEGFDVYARIRERSKAAISRGNDADEVLQDLVSPVSHFPFASIAALTFAPSDPQGYGVAMTDGGVLTHQTGALAGGVHVNGHGSVSVFMKSKRTLASGDPLIGQIGLAVGDTLTCWDAPKIDVVLPCWRNLLQNPRFNYPGGAVPWWVNVAVTVTSGTTFSVSRKTTDHYVQGNSVAAGQARQTLLIDSYQPRGMSALAWGYFRSASADVNDTYNLSVSALDSVGGSLASTATGVIAAPATTWVYNEAVVAACPVNTAQLRWNTATAEVAGGGTANNDVCVSEGGLLLGQFANNTATVLTNPSFVGTTASWTNLTNSMIIDTVNASPSSSYVRGGAFATSAIYQEFALPAGYQCGATAVVRCWRMTTLAGDAGEVKVDVMDGASVVLATATTTNELLATMNEWHRRIVSVNVPDGATKVRVTFTATRSLGAGNSGACLDDAHLSVHKKLYPTWEQTLDFSIPSIQPTPDSWQEYVKAYPAQPRPLYVFGPADFKPQLSQQNANDHTLEWSDNIDHPLAVMTGYFGLSSYVDAFKSVRTAGGAAPCIEARDGAIDSLAAFTSLTAFTVLTYFRVDELPWSGVSCGLVGRANLARGWSLEISAGGFLQAVFTGDLGTKTITGTTNVVDGAFHMGAVVYNPVAQTISLYSENGPEGTVSTAAGLGEFGLTAATCRLRILRSTSSNDTLPGMLRTVYMWSLAQSAPNIAAHWNYALAPIATGLVYSRDAVVWTDIGRHSASAPAGFVSNDRILTAFSIKQLAKANHPLLEGLALAKASTNQIPSWTFTNAPWDIDKFASWTNGVLDPTGKAAGVTVDATVTDGILVSNVPFNATATAVLVFYAKAALAQNVTVELRDNADVLKSTAAVVIGTTWSRFVVNLTAWDAATPTAKIRWRGTAGNVTFSLSHVIWCGQGTEVPVAYQGPAVAMTDTTVVVTNAIARQFNGEGEVVLEGITLKSVPAAGSLVSVRNNANNQNRRELTAAITGVATFNSYDGAAVNVVSNATAFDWSQTFSIRSRWNRLQMLDNAATPFGGIVVTASVNSAIYGRLATFSESALASSIVEINKGTGAGLNMTLRKVVLRTREGLI